MKHQETKEQALNRVKNANKKDYNDVFDFAKEFVKTQFKIFTSNELRVAYLEAGNELPTQLNVMGAVFHNLAKQGLIFHKGYTSSKTKVSKGCVIKTWYSLEMKKKQQLNASNQSNLKLEL